MGRSASAPPILCDGAPELRQRSRQVATDEDLGDLPARMLAALEAHDGVGLAAPQIGDRRRVIVVADPDRRPLAPMVMVNPLIHETFGPEILYEEGCLSFPGRFFTLMRPRGVDVTYRDVAGRTHHLRDESLLARVIQHEVDHLDGILFVDRLPRWRRWWLAPSLARDRRRTRKERA